tara:strand:+ start:81 stop:428 length:348 start_codon:yes stop_codon:yes gene_type:complete
MLDDSFFPTTSPSPKKKIYETYEFNTSVLENFLKAEMVRPTWNHNKVESLYASCSKTKRWADMNPSQSMDFCKCGRIALQNINRQYGNGMDIAAYHFPGLKQSVINKGHPWDPGF